MANWKPTTLTVPLPIIEGIRFARIPGWPDYAASDDGHIWSSKRGHWKHLKGFLDKNGYERVRLYHWGIKSRKTFSIARLILMAFRGLPAVRMESCHWDGNRRNNLLINLRWDTRSNNQKDSVRHGTHSGLRRGEAHATSTISYKTVCAIRATNGKPNYTTVARQFGVNRWSVKEFVLGLSRVDS